MFDFLGLFLAFLCHHDVYDFFRCFEFHDSASLYFVCEGTFRPETDPLSLLCHGLDSHERPPHLCLSRFNRHEFAFCISGHKQTSTLIPHNRLASRRVRYSGFRVPVTPVPSCCWMPCRHGLSCTLPCQLQT